MADLTADQIETIRDEIGTTIPPTDDDLNDLYQRTLTVPGVSLVIIRRRLADLLAAPGRLTDSGTSLDYTENIKRLTERAAVLEAEHAGALLGLDDDPTTNLGSGYLDREASSWR